MASNPLALKASIQARAIVSLGESPSG